MKLTVSYLGAELKIIRAICLKSSFMFSPVSEDVS